MDEGAAKGKELQPERENFMNAKDYLNDEEKFNETNRIVLFPKIDVNPRDGFVIKGKLTEWNLKQSERETLHRTKRDMEIHDKNNDGFVLSAEYDQPEYAFLG